ncbi:MAG: glycosyltransferase family 9 protein [Minisyncoccota bacterium]
MKRILVIQNAKLGDMVCTTPVFRAIKKQFPDTKLYVMGDPINKQVLFGNPNVDEYIKTKDASYKLFRNLKLDAVVMLNPNPRILWKLIISRVPKIIAPKVVGGFSPYMTKIYRILLLLVKVVPHRMHHYAPREYLSMLEPLGISSEDTKKELYFDKVSESRICEILRGYENSFKIAISPSAGNKIKNWGGKKFAKLIDGIYEKWRPAIFIIGTSHDQNEVNEVVSSLFPDTKIINLVTKLNIEELKAFMFKMNMFISVDTGPIYIAESFDVPTVDIIGPIDENEQPPRGAMHKWVVSPTRKEPLLSVFNARVYDVTLAKESTESISVRMVLEKVESLYKQVSSK